MRRDIDASSFVQVASYTGAQINRTKSIPTHLKRSANTASTTRDSRSLWAEVRHVQSFRPTVYHFVCQGRSTPGIARSESGRTLNSTGGAGEPELEYSLAK